MAAVAEAAASSPGNVGMSSVMVGVKPDCFQFLEDKFPGRS